MSDTAPRLAHLTILFMYRFRRALLTDSSTAITRGENSAT